jgi:hypothetical protein
MGTGVPGKSARIAASSRFVNRAATRVTLGPPVPALQPKAASFVDRFVSGGRNGGLSMARTILAILIIVVLVAIAAVATGFLDVSTKGQFRAPAVAVTTKAGEVPTVDIDTKRIVVEGRNQTVEVPEIGTTTTNVEVPVVRTEEQR